MNPDRPARVQVSGHRLGYPDGRSFPTWADAMAFADRLARFIRTSHQITEERQ